MENCFRVGYGRTNIMPDEPMPLDSYGNAEKRIMTNCLNEIFFSAVALTDEEDRTLLLMTYDITQCNRPIYEELRDYAVEKYGIAPEYVHLSGTHTHSSVALWVNWDSVVRYREKLLNRAKLAIDEAMADRKPAEMYGAENVTERLNFVRHYWRADGTTAGDNHGNFSTAPVISHVKEPDGTMRLLRFVRQGGRDLVLVNWQSHNHLTGGKLKTDLAADFSGALRSSMERRHDCLLTFFQGCAGDLNPKDNRLPQNNRTEDYRMHGELLAEYAEVIYTRMRKLKTGTIRSLTRTMTAPVNHDRDGLCDTAKKIHDDWVASGYDTKAAIEAGRPYGIESPYMASAIVKHSAMPAEKEIFVNAYRIGEVGWTSAPMEVFDTTGQEIRAASPFAMTFTQGYTDANFGYLPTRDAYEYGCYEADTTIWASGTAERVRDTLIELLKEL